MAKINRTGVQIMADETKLRTFGDIHILRIKILVRDLVFSYGLSTQIRSVQAVYGAAAIESLGRTPNLRINTIYYCPESTNTKISPTNPGPSHGIYYLPQSFLRSSVT